MAADAGPAEDRGLDADEALVLDGAGVDHGHVADGDVGANREGETGVDVEDAAVLDVGAGADVDGGQVGADDGVVPDAGVVGDADIADELDAGGQKDVAADGGDDAVGSVELGARRGGVHLLEEGFLLELAEVGVVEGFGGAEEQVEEGAEGAEAEDEEGGEEADVDVLGAAADVLPGPDEGGSPDGGAKGGQQGEGDGDGLADGFHAWAWWVGAALDCRRAVVGCETGRVRARKSFFQKTLEVRWGAFWRGLGAWLRLRAGWRGGDGCGLMGDLRRVGVGDGGWIGSARTGPGSAWAMGAWPRGREGGAQSGRGGRRAGARTG